MSALASKRRLLAMALIAIACVHLFAVLTMKRQILAGRSDFSAFYAAGKLLIKGDGHSLYSLEAQSRAQEEFQGTDADRAGTLPFAHPPFEVLIFAPLAALRYGQAFAIWSVINFFLLLGTVIVLRDHVPIIRERPAFVLISVGFFYPAIVTILQGQDSILLLFLFSLVYVQLSGGSDLRAGLILSFCTFKFQLVLPAFVALAAVRKWRAILGFAVGCIGLTGISAAVVGLSGLMQYPHFLVEYARLPAAVAAIYPENMPNLRGLLTLVLPPGYVRTETFGLISLALLVVLAFVFGRVRGAQRAQNLGFAACLTVTVFTAYHLNVHDVVLLAIPLILAADYLLREGVPSIGRKLMLTTAIVVYFAPTLSGPYRVIVSASSMLCLAWLLMRECLVSRTESQTTGGTPSQHFSGMQIPTHSEEPMAEKGQPSTTRLTKLDVLAAISASNLLFYPVWRIALSPEADFFRTTYARNALIAVMLNVCILTALLLVWFRWIRSKPASKMSGIAFRWGLLLTFVFAFQLITMCVFLHAEGHMISLMLLAIVLVGFAFAYVKHGPRLARMIVVLLAISAPGALVTFGQATWRLLRGNRPFEPGPNAVMKHNLPSRRVIWLVFDEWDQRLTFAQRPPDLSLPNLDRLRAESFVATDALPPSHDTFASFASLFTGHVYSSYRIGSAALLQISDGNGWRDLRSQELIFRRLQGMGLNTAALSWGMPLCRIIPEQLNECDFEPCAVLTPENASLLTSMVDHTFSSVPGLPFSGQYVQWKNEKLRTRHLDAYEQSLRIAIRFVTDPKLGFIVLHMPVPHPPGIYDRHRKVFATDGRASYVDNLVLVDQAVATLRSAMEKAGLWDKSAVFLLGDHSWRAQNWEPIWTPEDAAQAPYVDPRTPFLAKLPGQNKDMEYNSEFNTVLLHDLTLSVIKGEVTTADEMRKWLDENRTRVNGEKHSSQSAAIVYATSK